MNTLTQIGLTRWFEERINPDKANAHDIARVISVHKDRYSISKGSGEALAELSGNFYYSAENTTDLPTTGDWVYADFYDDDKYAIINGIIPRKTLLKRKSAGKQIDFQLIAANIDTAFIIQSADYNFNLRRLERYLVMVYESGITPVILLSKSDLVSSDILVQLTENIASIATDVLTIPFSNTSLQNLGQIKSQMKVGLTYCLLGSSGVGKTSLLNNLIEEDRFSTQEVSHKENKGRHTTTRRELTLLDNGALLIDTPGMRELGSLAVDSGLDSTFTEVLELAKLCKFGNCSHTNEKNCGVLNAIEQGMLTMERYNNYIKMRNESAFNEMSYVEKRKKDKDFGKMIRSTLKSKKR